MFLVGRCDGDQIDREGTIGERLHLFDLLPEDFRGGVSARETAEAARIADRSDKIRFRNPGHGSADDGIFCPKEVVAPFHQGLKIFQL